MIPLERDAMEERKPMKPIVVKIPLVTWRNGRPRYNPGKTHRALGYVGKDLRHPPLDAKGHPCGPWFTIDECIEWSRQFQNEVAQRRERIAAGATAAKVRREVQAASGKQATSLGQMLEAFFAQPRLSGVSYEKGRKHRAPLSANTIRYYRQGRVIVERFDDGFLWAYPVAAIKPRGLADVLGRIEEQHGLAQARCVKALLSTAFTFGVRERYVTENPVSQIDDVLPSLPPRVRYGSVAEMEHLVRVADVLGFPYIGDAIMLGLFTGQRQNDRLALEDGRVTPDGILFKQSKKHGQPLLIPAAPELAARLAAAKERRREWRVNWPHVLLCEPLRRPWEPDWYRKHFRVIRHAAATGDAEREKDGSLSKDARTIFGTRDVRAMLAQACLKPMPSLDGFRDQDLRDTAVTWLALAGCSKFEIASITGHTVKSIDNILSHYLGLHPELARSAIGKLVAWRGRQ